jgi:hypothetical protein
MRFADPSRQAIHFNDAARRAGHLLARAVRGDAESDRMSQSHHDSGPRGGWSRYARANMVVSPDFVPARKTGPLAGSVGIVADPIDLTLGVEDSGNISVSGYLAGARTRSADPLLRLELTIEEAQRLRDLLVWALADLPATVPPPECSRP